VTEVRIPGLVADRIVEHAVASEPFEACGLLVGRREEEAVWITRSVPCPNVAPLEERTRRFQIEPRAILNVRRTLRGTSESIVGFYHAHPDGSSSPSALDLEYIRLWPETVWVIAALGAAPNPSPRAWWLDAEETEPRELPLRVSRNVARTACPE
jgi:proteasome lid subunit RPN8/RPN11